MYNPVSPFGGGGVMITSHSNVNIGGNSTFVHNLASVTGGGVFAQTSSVHISGNTIFSGNSDTIANGGSVIVIYRSSVNISGNTIFSGNSALNGGGISAVFESNVEISGNTIFNGNSASEKEESMQSIAMWSSGEKALSVETQLWMVEGSLQMSLAM